ncbi:hypothetical protein B0H16DRAFT_1467185 [Mycena metata]|uniref:Uncharacterized protein n=1 Tax=Mycena metata TaxID=1033252 RepID=A0AAD7MWI8_9AGAR|nr:hypothetical protein B0H16DRAFT_1467185 [Mycena metata]
MPTPLTIMQATVAAALDPYSDGAGVNYVVIRELRDEVYEKGKITRTELDNRTEIKLTWIAHYSTPTRKLTDVSHLFIYFAPSNISEGWVHDEFCVMGACAPVSWDREWFKLRLVDGVDAVEDLFARWCYRSM